MSLRGISLGLVVASAVVAEQAAAGESKLPDDVPSAIRLSEERTTYAYCRLDSPQDLQANLLTGLSHSKCRLYLNGRDLGTLEGGSGWEFAREFPVNLRQGSNHLLVRFASGTRFACRLVGANAEPLRAVKTTIQAPNAQAAKAPEPPLRLAWQVRAVVRHVAAVQ